MKDHASESIFCPFVYLTQCNAAGINDFVMKPLNQRFLAEAIRRVLDKKEKYQFNKGIMCLWEKMYGKNSFN